MDLKAYNILVRFLILILVYWITSISSANLISNIPLLNDSKSTEDSYSELGDGYSLAYASSGPSTIGLLSVSPNTTNVRTVVTPFHLRSAVAAMTVRGQSLYFCDSFSHSIYVSNLSSPGEPPTVLIHRGIRKCSGLAVDSHNIYWSDKQAGSLHAASLTNTSVHATLGHASKPSSLLLLKGHIFFLSQDPLHPSLCKLALDSHFEVTCVPLGSVPQGLTSNSTHLFWWEGQSALYTLNPAAAPNASVVLRLSPTGNLPRSLAYLNSRQGLVWAEGDQLFHLASTAAAASPRPIPSPPLRISLLTQLTPASHLAPGDSPDCQHLTVPSSILGTFLCTCMDGFVVNPWNSSFCIPYNEMDCDSSSEFRCSDGSCIPKYLVCDGKKDCPLDDEEDQCGEDKCGEEEYKCDSGACIPGSKRCDATEDCSDGSDEHFCSEAPHLSLVCATTKPGSIQTLETSHSGSLIASTVVPPSNLSTSPAAMASSGENLFFCDSFSHRIYKSNLSAPQLPPEILVHHGIGQCSGLAAHSSLLAWIDQRAGSIVVARQDNPGLHRVLFSNTTCLPTSLLWTELGQLYFLLQCRDGEPSQLCLLSPGEGTPPECQNIPPGMSHSLTASQDNLYWWNGPKLLFVPLDVHHKPLTLLEDASHAALPQAMALLDKDEGWLVWADAQGELHTLSLEKGPRSAHSLPAAIPGKFLPILLVAREPSTPAGPTSSCQHLPLVRADKTTACICGVAAEPWTSAACIQICSQEEFKCTSGRCVPANKRCDRQKDCEDGSDEELCGASNCESPSHLCDNSTRCLRAELFCDGKKDCQDGSDEPDSCREMEEGCECQERCLLTAYGPTCACYEGSFLLADEKSCSTSKELAADASLCRSWGQCSQLCLPGNTANIPYTCACSQGYHLLDDGFSCSPNDEAEPLILVSTGADVRSYNLSSHQHQLILRTPGEQSALHLDYYLPPPGEESPLLVWCDGERQQILAAPLSLLQVGEVRKEESVVIAEGSLPSLEGLAVDWLRSRVYWLDSKLGLMEMASLDGTNRAAISTDLGPQPRGIALDPMAGFLFWSNVGQEKAGIKRSDLAGRNSTQILSLEAKKNGRPNGLTLDYATQSLYWVDGITQSVNMMDYDGRNTRAIRSTSDLFHPFSVALWGNEVFWTDWQHKTLSKGSRWREDKIEILLVGFPHIYDVKVLHPSRQPRDSKRGDPCQDKNGGCSHLCFPAPKDGVLCGCPYGWELDSEGSQCVKTTGLSSVVSLVSHGTLSLKSLSNHLLLPPFHLKQEILEAKPSIGGLHLYFPLNHTIYRKNLRDRTRDTLLTLDSDLTPLQVLPGPRDLVYFLVRGTGNHGYIAVCNTAGEHLTTLVTSRLSHPLAFAVDRTSGQLFWAHGHPTKHDNGRYEIYTSRFDGEHRRELITTRNFPNLGKPTHLEVLPRKKMVFWLNEDHTFSYLEYGHSTQPRLHVLTDVEALTTVDSQSHLLLKKFHDPSIYLLDVDNFGPLALFQVEGGHSATHLLPSAPLEAERPGPGKCALYVDSSKCITRHAEPYVVYVKGGVPRALAASREVRAEVQSPLPLTQLVFHRTLPLMVWADSNHSIHLAHTEGRHRETVAASSDPIVGLAVDWIADNLYWITFGRESMVHVARLDGSHHYVLHQDPRMLSHLAVDPLEGALYWSRAMLSVERAPLTAAPPQQTLHQLLHQLGELVVDPSTSDIYWTSPLLGSIERSRPDGSARVLVASGLGALFSLAIAPQGLYWLDSYSNGGSIMFSDKKGANVSVMAVGLGRDTTMVRWHGYGAMNRTSYPCGRKNGGCHHLCLAHQNGNHQCLCSQADLGPDGHSCQTSRHYLLLGHGGYLDSFQLSQPSDPNQPFPRRTFPDSSVTAMVLDSRNQLLYYGDFSDPYLFSLKLSSGQKTPILPMNSDTIRRIEGLALDAINDRLYWTDGAFPAIWTLDLQIGTFGRFLELDSYEQPKSLAVDPCNKMLFWADWSKEGAVYSVSLSGGPRKRLDPVTPHPSGLTLHKGQLYWAAPLGTSLSILTSNDGRTSTMVLQHQKSSGNHGNHVVLAVHGRALYWAYGGALYVHGVEPDPHEVYVVERNLQDPLNGLVAYDSAPTSCQDKYRCSEACLNGGVCGVLNSSALPQCLCREGYGGLSCQLKVGPSSPVVGALVAGALVGAVLLAAGVVACLRWNLRSKLGSWIKSVSWGLCRRRQSTCSLPHCHATRTYVEYYNLANPVFEDICTSESSSDPKLFFLNTNQQHL